MCLLATAHPGIQAFLLVINATQKGDLNLPHRFLVANKLE